MGLSGPLPYGSWLWTLRGSGSFKPVGLSGPFLSSSDYLRKKLGSFKPMGLSGLEPPTSRLSGVRSNQLSYKPSYNSGSHLLSHTVSSAVPSAAWVLTIVFGMGTGVSPKRIATRNFWVLITQQQNNLYLFFRFSWIDSAVRPTLSTKLFP